MVIQKNTLIQRIVNAFIDYEKGWSLFEKIWLIVFTAINIYLFYVWNDSIIGLIASLTGMICVVLTAKARISSFYFGLVNIISYSYVAFQSKYFGDVMLNMLFFLPMTFFGIYFWKKNLKQNKNGEVKIKSLSWKKRFTWFVIALVCLSIYGFILNIINGTLPFIDAATTVFSIIATIMLNKRLTEQWFFWIMVNILSIVMWAHIFIQNGGDISILVMWSAFLVNAIYGYYNWRKLEKKENEK